MTQNREKRGRWRIVVEVCALAVFVATIVCVAAFSGFGQQAADPLGALSGTEAEATGADGEEDVSQVADAGTVGLPETGEGEQGVDQETTQYVPNEALVMIDDPAVLDTLVPGAKVGDALVKSVEVLSEDPDEGTVVKLTLEGDASTESTIDALNAMEGVSAQKNYIYHLM